MRSQRVGRRRRGGGAIAARRWPAAALGSLALAACTTIPAPVVSPYPPAAAATPALTWSAGWGFATAHIRRPDGSIQTIKPNGDHSEGITDPGSTEITFIMPAAASVHAFSADWDEGVYAGWRRFGGTARRRLVTDRGGFATSLALAANVGYSLRTADASLALEQALPLGGSTAALLRLGVGYGRREYDVAVPSGLDTNGDASLAVAHFTIRRNDARIEPTAGVILAGGWLVLSVQPYFVFARGAAANAGCPACVAGVDLLDFAQDWGLAVAVTLHGR